MNIHSGVIKGDVFEVKVAKVNIPKSIKVGGINYKVELVDYLTHDEVGTKWGECDYQHSVIKIWNGLSDEKQEQTFVHELTHAIAHEAGIDDQDEDLINRLALVAYQVVKENDSLFSKTSGFDVYGKLTLNGVEICKHGIGNGCFCKDEAKS